MKKLIIYFLCIIFSFSVGAIWIWIFGDSTQQLEKVTYQCGW